MLCANESVTLYSNIFHALNENQTIDYSWIKYSAIRILKFSNDFIGSFAPNAKKKWTFSLRQF